MVLLPRDGPVVFSEAGEQTCPAFELCRSMCTRPGDALPTMLEEYLFNPRPYATRRPRVGLDTATYVTPPWVLRPRRPAGLGRSPTEESKNLTDRARKTEVLCTLTASHATIFMGGEQGTREHAFFSLCPDVHTNDAFL